MGTRSDRARDFSLASLAVGYPDDELAATAEAVGASLAEHPALGPLLRFAAAHGMDALRGEWIDRFDQGKGRVSLYETEYGRMRGMSKGNDLADLAGFYRAFGLELSPDAHEMLDYLPVELEFYATLLAKESYLRSGGDEEGVATVSDARGKFLAAHLGSFGQAVAPRLPHDELYGPAARFVAACVAEECALLGVTPAPLDYYAADPESANELACATLPILR